MDISDYSEANLTVTQRHLVDALAGCPFSDILVALYEVARNQGVVELDTIHSHDVRAREFLNEFYNNFLSGLADLDEVLDDVDEGGDVLNLVREAQCEECERETDVELETDRQFHVSSTEVQRILS